MTILYINCLKKCDAAAANRRRINSALLNGRALRLCLVREGSRDSLRQRQHISYQIVNIFLRELFAILLEHEAGAPR